MSEIQKIAKLLAGDSIEKQIAAAIVLGELRPKGPEVTSALGAALDVDVPLLQRHVLVALARTGAKKALPKILPLLSARDTEVRRAAIEAVTSIGEEVVPTIRARMASAPADERRALDAVLAELGGKDAFSTLLAGLASGEEEAAKAAAIAVRQHVKNANGNARRSYVAETEKFLAKLAKNKGSSAAVAAAIKILGYCEEPKVLGTLVSYAKDKKQPAPVRLEAIIAMRFALGDQSGGAKVAELLLDAAADDDRTLAQTALHTLGSLALPAGLSKRLEKLVAHPDLERARFVIEQLGRQGDVDAVRILSKVLCETDRKRAEIAAAALVGKEAAVPLLAKALLTSLDPDRAWMVRNVLRPMAKKVQKPLQKELLEEAMNRFGKGERNWEALLDVVRDADPDAAANALRGLAQKLRKGDHKDKTAAVLGLLCRSDRATDDDRYALASLELAKSGKDTRPAARAGDEALRQLHTLLGRGYDVVSALRKDRGLGLEELFYAGFHFTEAGHPAGEELLSEVVKKGGRSKLAKMAKNKLSLSASS